MNVYPIYDNPSNSCFDFNITTVVNTNDSLVVVLGEQSGDQ